MKKEHLFLASALLLLGVGCLSGEPTDLVITDAVIDRDAILFDAKEQGLIMDDVEMTSMNTSVSEDGGVSPEDAQAYLNMDTTDWASAGLADVTGGGSYGVARSAFLSGQYKLVVDMGGLPTPSEGYFYEGWIVRRGADMSVVSTGKAQVNGEGFVNVYLSSTNLADHDFYVLTLEPDDGDPAPAEHILEGTLR